jgi:aromatic ring-opening dioxygenase catalytic subunit (LigB family)
MSSDIPVIQMRLDYNMNAQQHYDLSRELQGLRNKGILIIGKEL